VPNCWHIASVLARITKKTPESASVFEAFVQKLGPTIALSVFDAGTCGSMLRITVTESALEERWILQGKLTKGSVAELISTWRASTACPSGKCRVVDLEQVISIDKSGEEALSILIGDGATVLASGVYTRHLVDELRAQIAGKKP
jgi:hypothetical protein